MPPRSTQQIQHTGQFDSLVASEYPLKIHRRYGPYYFVAAWQLDNHVQNTFMTLPIKTNDTGTANTAPKNTKFTTGGNQQSNEDDLDLDSKKTKEKEHKVDEERDSETNYGQGSNDEDADDE